MAKLSNRELLNTYCFFNISSAFNLDGLLYFPAMYCATTISYINQNLLSIVIKNTDLDPKSVLLSILYHLRTMWL